MMTISIEIASILLISYILAFIGMGFCVVGAGFACSNIEGKLWKRCSCIGIILTVLSGSCILVVSIISAILTL